MQAKPSLNVSSATSQEAKFPVLSKELIDELNKRYPERCPEPDWSDREIWLRAGERRLVRKLNAEFEKQQKNILKT